MVHLHFEKRLGAFLGAREEFLATMDSSADKNLMARTNSSGVRDALEKIGLGCTLVPV